MIPTPPADWVRLYGKTRPVKTTADGWTMIGLAKFPFPLKARVVHKVPQQRVRWEFGGFWRGVAEINFAEGDGETLVDGFEYIVPHGLWVAAGLAERLFMETELRRIWALGWKRLRALRA